MEKDETIILAEELLMRIKEERKLSRKELIEICKSRNVGHQFVTDLLREYTKNSYSTKGDLFLELNDEGVKFVSEGAWSRKEEERDKNLIETKYLKVSIKYSAPTFWIALLTLIVSIIALIANILPLLMR